MLPHPHAFVEGLVKEIAAGSKLKLLGTYVVRQRGEINHISTLPSRQGSPLCWAISTGVNNARIQAVEDLRGGTFAVSRMGSGSHLMAYVLAIQRGPRMREEG